MKVRRLNIPRKASSLFLPILTDEEYSKYNDINRMKMLIDEFIDRGIVKNKATRKNVTDLTHPLGIAMCLPPSLSTTNSEKSAMIITISLLRTINQPTE